VPLAAPSAAPGPAAPSVKERVELHLSEHLDPTVAATAVRVASRTWLRTEPEALVPSQLLGLLQGLAPLLEHLLGAEQARVVVERILRDAPR
jgi:hypothetical protein